MGLFHSAPIKLAPGSVILPGNYGRIIQATGTSHSRWSREVALEQIRTEHYPSKPSRLHSCFACTEEAAMRFYVSAMANKGPNLWPLLYQVEKVEQDAIEHRADFNVVEPLRGHPATMTEIAHHYWRSSLWVTITDAPEIRCEELVTTSPLRVLRALD
jgi:hypothetical protein